jgi:hypothetical protein
MPWWNHFEGVGTPLLGEMQSATLFPLTWLLLLPDGQLYLHIALQLIAGVSAWFLLRRLGCTPAAATAAAIAFEFNGTFSWLANAVVNPIPFLPLILLGVETVRERVGEGRGGGSAWITIGMAASLYAGFPEVAYLNGLLIGAWTLVRALSLGAAARWGFLARVLLGAVAGLAIAAPALVPFVDYLLVADLGGHDGAGFAAAHLEPQFLPAILLPYAFGGIFQYPQFAAFWGSVGGYAGCVLFGLALVGAMGREHRALRWLLVAWVAATVAFSYGLPGLATIAKVVPGIGSAAFYRYIPPSWEFSLCVLAGLGLSDLGREPGRWRLAVAGGLTVLACAVTLAVARQHEVYLGGTMGRANVAFVAVLLAGGAALAWVVKSRAVVSAGLAVLLVAEAGAYFLPPALTWPAAGKVQEGGVAYLKAHIGLQRFATLGPIQPNYGAYYGLASVNHNDLPIPKTWTAYVARHLDREAAGVLFTGSTIADDLVRDPDAYRKVGVRYVLASAGSLQTEPFRALQAAIAGSPDGHLKPVYADAGMTILELSRPAPYFSAPGCALVPVSRDEVRASCAGPAALTRLELHMEGWRAEVGGQRTAIAPVGEIFQQVRLPAGASTITFRFEPPHMGLAWLAFGVGWVLFAADLAWGRRRGPGAAGGPPGPLAA